MRNFLKLYADREVLETLTMMAAIAAVVLGVEYWVLMAAVRGHL